MSTKSKSEILALIQAYGPVTKKDLQMLTELKLTTLNRLLSSLFDKRYIYLTEEKASTGGRPSNSIDIDRSHYAVIGIDVSRTYIKLMLTSLKMDIVSIKVLDLTQYTNKNAVIEDLVSNIKLLLSQNCNRDIIAIGIGAVGPIDVDRGILLKPTYGVIDDWDDMHIKDIIESKFNIKVYVNNGTNLALTAQTYRDFDRYKYNYAYINCGVGIRNSTMIKGEIVRTSREDTLGHMSVSDNMEICYCGSNGCIDLLSSIGGMVTRYNKKTDMNITIGDFKKLFEMDYNKSIFNQIFKEGSMALGKAIANYIKMYDLNYVIVSGPLVRYSNSYFNNMVKSALEYLGDFYKENVEFIKDGEYQTNSIAIGSGVYAIRQYFEEIYMKK